MLCSCVDHTNTNSLISLEEFFFWMLNLADLSCFQSLFKMSFELLYSQWGKTVSKMCAISVIVDVGFGWAVWKRETSVIDVVSVRTFLINKHYQGIQSNKIGLNWRLIWIFNIYIKPYISATLLIMNFIIFVTLHHILWYFAVLKSFSKCWPNDCTLFSCMHWSIWEM